MKRISTQVVFCLILACSVVAMHRAALADTKLVDFEDFAVGYVDRQNGWTSGTIGHGPSATPYLDVKVVPNTYGYPGFGTQSLRISNGITSSGFGDQTFSVSLADAAGEISASTSTFSGGVRQPYFEAQWDLASAVPGSVQPGLSVVASADEGDGARMSWLQMQDTPTGIQLNFDDFESSVSNFVVMPIATGIDRTIPHTIKMTMDFVEGPSNDVVKIYLDGALIHTGTSWEDYARLAGGATNPVDSIMFRVAGTAVPANLGKGFLIDNFSEYSGPVPIPPATPPAPGWDYAAWVDRGIGYTAPAGGDAYYPSAIYDAAGFGGSGHTYAMWYSDGAGSFYEATSTDGVSWGSPSTMAGLADVDHVQVLYDAHCFGAMPCDAATAKYKMWFWDMGAPTLYNISSMATADSADGIHWADKASITQDPTAKLIQDPDSGVGWNRGTYGPVSMFYQPDAADTGTDPWDHRYVMYYDGTDGVHEDTGLAYSTDGLDWSANTSNPVLSHSGVGGSQAWDCVKAVYGTVFKDLLGYHYFYSGSGQGDGSGGCASSGGFTGIGLASSTDGEAWHKDAGAIFEIGDGAQYRSGSIYAPSVIDDGSGILRMYFSAESPGGQKKIGYATLIKPAFLRVMRSVIAAGGGTTTPSDLKVHVTSSTSTPDLPSSMAIGTSAPAILYALPAGTYIVREDPDASYAQSFGTDCPTGSIALAPGDDKTCTVIDTYTAAPPPSPPIPAPAASGGMSMSRGGGRAMALVGAEEAAASAAAAVEAGAPGLPDTGRSGIVTKSARPAAVQPEAIRAPAANPPLFDVISEPIPAAQQSPVPFMAVLIAAEAASISLALFVIRRVRMYLTKRYNRDHR